MANYLFSQNFGYIPSSVEIKTKTGRAATVYDVNGNVSNPVFAPDGTVSFYAPPETYRIVMHETNSFSYTVQTVVIQTPNTAAVKSINGSSPDLSGNVTVSSSGGSSLTPRTDNTTEILPVTTSTTVTASGITKTAPVLSSIGAKFELKNYSAGTIILFYPNRAGVTQTYTMLSEEYIAFEQSSASGWTAYAGNNIY